VKRILFWFSSRVNGFSPTGTDTLTNESGAARQLWTYLVKTLMDRGQSQGGHEDVA